jgi:aspartate kinase
MQAVGVTIGRNRRPESTVEPHAPLDDTAWAGFVGSVRDTLDHHLARPGSWIEVHYGAGEWDGVREESAKVTILGVPDRPGIAYQILDPIADANIEVDVIVQNISKDGTTDFSFTVHRNDLKKTLDILKKVCDHIGARELIGDDKCCKVGLVGVGMRSHVGVASKMFRALAEEGINIQMISTSEIKITVVIDEKYMELAVRVLHKVFDLEFS